MIDVSVIIPVFNAESTLAQCLDSVLAQTVAVEVLCVDDGSTDSSMSILHRYANEHINVRVFEQDNLGPGPARNLALDHASGRFVAFMDADDLYPDPDSLRSLVNLADANDCRVAGGYLRLFTESGDPADSARYTNGWISRNRYPRFGVISFSEYQSPLGYQRYIFDRAMLDESKIRFKPLRRFQDPPFCVSALHAAGRLVVTDRAVYLYRRGNQVIDWAGEGGVRAQHFLDGRLWILQFAREHNYAKLFEMMYEDIYRPLPPEVQAMEEVARRYRAIEAYVSSLNRRTIGVALHDLSQGGIQRVVSILVPMFVHHWYRVVLLTTCGRTNDVYQLDVPTRRVVLGDGKVPEMRGARLIQAIKEHQIDVVIFHEYYSPKLAGDVAAVKSTGVPYVVHHHNKFSNFFRRLAGALDEGLQYRIFCEAAALITLSTSDDWYFRALGANTHFLPNPVRDVPKTFVCQRTPKTILWMARYTNIKRPADAIRILKKVLVKHPDAKLVMLGDLVGPEAERAQVLVQQDEQLRSAVSFEGFQADVWSYLSKVSIFLTTSSFEGFLYTLAEASAAGVPTVGYELPYLEMAKDNEGFIQVPQQNTAAVAEAICRLFEDAPAYERASRAARAAFERICAVDQMAAYDRIISEVLEGRRSVEAPTDRQAMILRETVSDACWGIVELKRRLDTQCRDMKQRVADRDKWLAIEKKKVADRDKLLANERRKVADLESKRKRLVSENTKLARKNEAYKREVDKLKNAEAYRVGMAVTWPARRVYRGLKCWRENGFVYTLRRIFLGRQY